MSGILSKVDDGFDKESISSVLTLGMFGDHDDADVATDAASDADNGNSDDDDRG